MSVLSVVIPAYNEHDGITAIIDRVLAVRQSLREVGVQDLELIVVDDGSRDGTADLAASYPDVTLVRHEVNRGYGAALKTGFRQAKGDLLAFLDADGTYPPEYFPRLCQEALGGAELVIGSRMAGEKSEMPVVRRVGNVRVSDSASGMRVFRKEILPCLYPLPDGLNFTPIMSTRAIHEKVKMVEVPIPYRERVGRSKLKVLRDGTRYLQSITWTALNYNPVRLLGGVSVLLGTLALSLLFVLGLVRLSGVTTLGAWGVAGAYLAMLSAVASVSLFSLGAMFNYLVSLFYRKPIKQGLFGRPIFDPPLDHQFGWVGALAFLGGGLVGLVSFFLALNGWPVTRLWLWLLGAAMAILVGLNLMISWLVMRVLEELSRRDALASDDLEGRCARP